MSGTGFGLPKGLLNKSTQPSAPSAPIIPIPPAPSFGDVRFQVIGKQPSLLERFSNSVVTRESGREENMSTTPDSERPRQNLDQNTISSNRFSLPRPLAEMNKTNPTSPGINDNAVFQGSASSSRSSIVNPNPAVSTLRISSHPFDVSKINSTQGSSSGSSLNSHLSPSSSLAMDGITERSQDSGGFSPSMQLGYPSASPVSNATADHAMEDVQHTRPPDRPPLPPVPRKYDGLRQIQARLQSSILNASSPNLASVTLLTNSAYQKATSLQAEARRLQNFSQEILAAAQKNNAAAQALLKTADEVWGVTEGAKAELDRLSLSQQHSMTHEIPELFQTMDNWISNQEADEATLRARRIEQLKLRKQKAELVRAAAQHTAASPSSVSAVAPELPPPPRQPLFFSPTPEVDIKADPQTWARSVSQSTPASSPAALIPADLARRQEDLRKKIKEKRSSDAESRSVSPSDVNRSEQQRLEERKQEEQKQKEALARKSLERKAHEEEERKAREKMSKEKEEAEQRAREQAETERKLREQAAADAEKARQEAEAQKALEASEARKKSQEAEEAKRKAQHEEQEKQRRQAEAEAEKQRMAAFLKNQKLEEERQAKLAEEKKQRALQEERDRDERLFEEQNRKKAEREEAERLRREYDLRRQRVQEEKNKALADRAQEIRARRESHLRSTDVTSEMSIDSSPLTSTLVLNPRDPPSAPSSSNVPNDDPPLSPLEPQLHPAPNQIPTSQSLSGVRSTSGIAQQAKPPTSHSTTHSNTQRSPNLPRQPITPTRNISLPPVAHFSPADSPPPLPQLRQPTQSTWSIHRLSGDGGNLPYRENPNVSPQAHAANLRPVANALHIPFDPSLSAGPDQSRVPSEAALVKREPVQDDSTLLQVPSRLSISTSETIPIRPPSSHSQGPIRVESQPIASHPTFPPGRTNQPLPTKSPHGSHTNTILDRPLSSLSSVTDAPVKVSDPRRRPQNSPRSNQSQLPIQLPPSSSSQTHLSSSADPQSELLQLAPPPTGQRSRSRSPFRMGPDEYGLQLAVQTPSDTGSDNQPPPPTYNGRPEPQIMTPVHWDHYSPAPRSPPRASNTYRPNYASRNRSPVAGRKRSRDYSPPPNGSTLRDYRDYDDRRPPRRYSRSPPPRRPRPISRSPSPPYSGRPPLASRLTQSSGGGDSYRPPSPREREPRSSRPELLDRFTDAQPSFDAPPRPGRGRGRRGRGGPPPGSSHASLEQRISGTTLMHRLEDPRRP